MSAELIGILGVGAALAGIIFAQGRSLRADHNRLSDKLSRVAEDVAEIRGHLFGVRPREETTP